MTENWKSPETAFFEVTGSGWTLIALEAWRRGIDVQLRSDRSYRLSLDGVELSFKLSRLDQESVRDANRIVNSKEATKELLNRNGVRTPQGSGYVAPFNRAAINARAEDIGFPVAIKANNWSKGRGVYSKVADASALNYYLSVLIDELECRHLLVEEHVRGTDFRYYVVGQSVVAVIRKVRAHVVGDGVATVRDLISRKNDIRKSNPYLRNAPIRIDSEVEKLLSDASLNVESVPDAGQLVYLREKSNVSAGGDSVDFTDSASLATKQLAVDAVSSLPGVAHGGVDILVENFGTEQESAAVLEINAAAELGLHMFPAEGAPRDIPSSLIDHYFPGSARLQPKAENWYFDLKAATAPILKGAAAEVRLVPIPSRPAVRWVSIRFEGKVQGVGFRSWVVRRALIAKVHGEVSNQRDGSVVARLCGTSRGIEKFLNDRTALPKSSEIVSSSVATVPPFIVTPGVSIS